MKQLLYYFLVTCTVLSCTKEELNIHEESSIEAIDESIFTFKEGFYCRELNTNILAVLPNDNSILLVKPRDEVDEFIKFGVSSQSTKWVTEVRYREQVCAGEGRYLFEDVILFRDGHRDFAINLKDGALLYDVEREDTPHPNLTGIGTHYFSQGLITDDILGKSKEIVLIGDILQSDFPAPLICPEYDTISNDKSLGRIMGVHAFEDEMNEQLLAIRHFDFGSENTAMKDMFSVYNVNQSKWVVDATPLEYHITGTQSVIDQDIICYGSQSHVSCLDLKSGKMKWVTEASSLSPSRLLAFADGDVFVKNYSGMLQRRKAATGALIWETHLGNIQRFIIVQDKLFSIGHDFSIIDIESGNILHAYSSPYIDYDPNHYFSNTRELMGYFDKESGITHIYINFKHDMICYELSE